MYARIVGQRIVCTYPREGQISLAVNLTAAVGHIVPMTVKMFVFGEFYLLNDPVATSPQKRKCLKFQIYGVIFATYNWLVRFKFKPSYFYYSQ